MDDYLLNFIQCLQTAKETAKIEPSHICRIELGKEINNSLNRLFKAKKIKVGDTINDKYIYVEKN